MRGPGPLGFSWALPHMTHGRNNPFISFSPPTTRLRPTGAHRRNGTATLVLPPHCRRIMAGSSVPKESAGRGLPALTIPMNPPNNPTAPRPSPWIGVLLGGAGFLALILGLSLAILAQREFRLWLCTGHYVEVELEVTKFTPKPR